MTLVFGGCAFPPVFGLWRVSLGPAGDRAGYVCRVSEGSDWYNLKGQLENECQYGKHSFLYSAHSFDTQIGNECTVPISTNSCTNGMIFVMIRFSAHFLDWGCVWKFYFVFCTEFRLKSVPRIHFFFFRLDECVE